MTRRVLLTGHRGRLGRAFVHRYRHLLDIRGFDLADGLDVRDVAALETACQNRDVVVHLAGLARPCSDASFADYFSHNVEGTHCVAHVAAASGVRRLVYASSMAVYGLEDGIPPPDNITERTPAVAQRVPKEALRCTEPQLAYHTSKVMAEQLLSWFGLTDTLEVVALRLGPVDVLHMGHSLSLDDACAAIFAAIKSQTVLSYHTVTVTEPRQGVDLAPAQRILGFMPGITEPSTGKPEGRSATRVGRP